MSLQKESGLFSYYTGSISRIITIYIKNLQHWFSAFPLPVVTQLLPESLPPASPLVTITSELLAQLLDWVGTSGPPTMGLSMGAEGNSLLGFYACTHQSMSDKGGRRLKDAYYPH
ncbi:hypothetical protein CHUAL_001654 [Chamberlinius hualienensis]